MTTNKKKTVERIWGALMSDETIYVGEDLDVRVELYEVWGQRAEHLVRDKEAVVELVDHFWGTPGLTLVVINSRGLTGFKVYATFTKLKAAERWADSRPHRRIWFFDRKKYRWRCNSLGSGSAKW